MVFLRNTALIPVDIAYGLDGRPARVVPGAPVPFPSVESPHASHLVSPMDRLACTLTLPWPRSFPATAGPPVAPDDGAFGRAMRAQCHDHRLRPRCRWQYHQSGLGVCGRVPPAGDLCRQGRSLQRPKRPGRRCHPRPGQQFRDQRPQRPQLPGL